MICVFYNMKHLIRIKIAKWKSRSRIFILIICLYRIFKSSGLTNDRNRTITHRHHLAKSAWFKQRRHQESICRRIDLVCTRLWISDISRNFVRILGMKMMKRILVLILTRSQNYKLNIQLCYHIIQYIRNEIKSLLLCHSWNNTNHKSIFPDRKSEFLLQRCFVLFLYTHYILWCKVCLYVRIRLRIKFIIINSV